MHRERISRGERGGGGEKGEGTGEMFVQGYTLPGSRERLEILLGTFGEETRMGRV